MLRKNTRWFDITKDAPLAKILEESKFSRALFEVYEGGVEWSYRGLHVRRSLYVSGKAY